MSSRVEIENEDVVTVHLGDGDVTFENGHVLDGPAVLHDGHGPLAGCDVCNWTHGYDEGPVGEVLARQAALRHRCPPIRQALAVLAAHHELERRKAQP
jgi:hypothetical protein